MTRFSLRFSPAFLVWWRAFVARFLWLSAPWTKAGKHRALAEIDLGPVRSLLVTKKKWSVEVTRDVEARYRLFLSLIIDAPGKTFSPPHDVDEFWHMHILDSPKYVRDCDVVFGRYIHHNPHLSVGSPAQRAAWQNTQRHSSGTLQDRSV